MPNSKDKNPSYHDAFFYSIPSCPYLSAVVHSFRIGCWWQGVPRTSPSTKCTGTMIQFYTKRNLLKWDGTHGCNMNSSHIRAMKWVGVLRNSDLVVPLRHRFHWCLTVIKRRNWILLSCGRSTVLYVCRYKEWTMKSGPCTATFNDLLYFPFWLTLY
jgi:hypothetical protein